MATVNQTQITPPRVSLVDASTGAVSREWYRWFYSLYTFIGEGTGILPVTSGGTGLGTIPTNGQLLIGNGTGYTLNTLGAGTGISVTNGAGTATVANTGVLSVSGGTTGLTPAAATTGAVTLSGTLIAVNGGTGFSSYAVGDLLYANTTTTLAKLPDVATGNALISGGVSTAPAWGKIGLTTHVSGVLPIANGGTNGSATPTAYGISYGTGTTYSFTAAGTAKQVLIANTGSAPTWSTLTSGSSILYGDGSGGFSNVTIGTGVSFVAGTLSATGTGGTVTSVTGTSPVVSSGGTTPAISLAAAYGDTLNPYASKTANYVLAAPNGVAGVPTFRALVAADVPGSALTKADDTNVTLTLGGSPTTALVNAASLTLGWTGQLAVSRGGTGLSAGTSGGIPYFSSASTLATSAALASGAIVLGGGAGVTPATTTTGTGVVTALGVNTGTAGAFVVNGGALGTPSSGTVTNLTGTASININGTVGATTANTGAFTTLSTTGNISNNSANPNLILNAAASAQTVNYYARTAGVDRIAFGKNNTAESGANAGSDFFINRFSDAGGYLGQFLIARSDGLISTGGSVNVAGALSATSTVRTGGYTVATLPAGTIGMRAYVTDALAPGFLTIIVGGGAVVTPVFYNGANWVAG